MKQKGRYVPKEDKEFVGMMLDIARRPGEKPVVNLRSDANEKVIDNFVERIKKGESLRKPDKKEAKE